MNAHTENVQILRDANGHPTFAILPFAQYQALVHGKDKFEPGIPNAVVNAVFEREISTIAAWREHLRLTQAEIAERMGISQAAFAQMETAKRPRKATLAKIAAAMGISVEQLAW